MTPKDVLDFWLTEVGEKGWYAGGEALDALCRTRFAATLREAQAGRIESWRSDPDGVLAYLILTDQLPRNIHRGRAEAFATDWQARAAAGEAIALDWDLLVAEPQRQFFYLPFVHAEDLARQDFAIRCFAARMPNLINHLHARAHREVIRRFGRFPFRNDALGRATTADEQAFLDAGGYGALVQAMRAAQGPMPTA